MKTTWLLLLLLGLSALLLVACASGGSSSVEFRGHNTSAEFLKYHGKSDNAGDAIAGGPASEDMILERAATPPRGWTPCVR